MGGIIYVYKYVVRSRVQDRTLRTPARISVGVDISPSTVTMNLHCERKELMSLIKLVENSNLDNLYTKPRCHVVSKAFSMFKNTAAVDILLLKLRVTWSVSLIHCNVVLWHARNLNWLGQNQSQSHNATDSQSIIKSWCRAPSGAHNQIFITLWQLRSCFLRCPLRREDGSVFC
jgi:hypothetical protein